MSKIIGFQCDSIESLNTKTDSTLLFARLCENKGYKIFFFEPNSLILKSNILTGSGQFVTLPDSDLELPINVSRETILLSELSYCFIRQNPPFDLRYIFNMYLLERLEGKVRFLNPPSAIRNNPEKLSPLNFPEYIPNTFIGSDLEAIAMFLKTHKKIVIKSIYGFGGFDVICISTEDELMTVGREFIDKHGSVIVQEFLDSVYEGDKRVLIVNGDVVAYFRRLPPKDSFVTNTIQGGSYELCELSEKERMIAQDVADYLKDQKIIFAGIDLIGEKLIEINITSPTGFMLYNRMTNSNCVDLDFL